MQRFHPSIVLLLAILPVTFLGCAETLPAPTPESTEVPLVKADSRSNVERTPFGADAIVSTGVDGPKDETSVPIFLVGEYYLGDGTGFNLHLTLNKDGTYACKWTGCMGEYGRCAGLWSGNAQRVKLITKSAEDMLKSNPLGDLDVGNANGKTILIMANDRKLFDKHGDSRFTAFHRVNEVPGF